MTEQEKKSIDRIATRIMIGGDVPEGYARAESIVILARAKVLAEHAHNVGLVQEQDWATERIIDALLAVGEVERLRKRYGPLNKEYWVRSQKA